MKKTGGTLPRFFAPNLDPVRDVVTLPADESRHLARVLRLRPGDSVLVFDGRGAEFNARVERIDRDAVVVALGNRLEPAPEPRVPFSLVQGVLKGHAMDGVIRDATMMGARVIQPVVTRHVALKTSGIIRADVLDRWHRIAVSSAKQCRRATVPAVAKVRTFGEWLSNAEEDLRLLFVEPAAGCATRSARSFIGQKPPANAAVIVGPEGGWTREEIETATAAGCAPMTLGNLTLRADAVPVAAIAVFRFLFEEA